MLNETDYCSNHLRLGLLAEENVVSSYQMRKFFILKTLNCYCRSKTPETKKMIEIREARTDDEAWMIEKMNQENLELESFAPRDFMLAVEDSTEKRLCFARTEHVRNVDDTEFVEINSFVSLDQAEEEHRCELVSGLVDKVQDNGENQVFAFSRGDHDVFLEVGFESADEDKLPDVMTSRLSDKRQKFGDNVTCLRANPSNVDYEKDDKDEFEKPDEVSEEEVEQIRDELDIDENPSTKYEI